MDPTANSQGVTKKHMACPWAPLVECTEVVKYTVGVNPCKQAQSHLAVGDTSWAWRSLNLHKLLTTEKHLKDNHVENEI